jgi:hypothetical protein
MLGIGAIAPNQPDPFDGGIEQGIGAAFAQRAGFGTVNLRDVE